MKKIISLDNLDINDKAKVLSIDSKCELKRRFEDLGITRGSIIKCEFKAPFKPLASALILTFNSFTKALNFSPPTNYQSKILSFLFLLE